MPMMEIIFKSKEKYMIFKMKLLLIFVFNILLITNTHSMPENAKTNAYGNGWTCVSGFRQIRNECIKVETPPNAKLNYAGNGWECVSGFRQVSNGCVKVELPNNAKLNYAGNGWECVSGFRQVSNGCVKVELPNNAKLNYAGNGWECVSGFRQVSNGCVKVDLPDNSKLNYAGNGWECVSGFRQVSNGCVKVELPNNAKLNYAGNGWECNKSYKISSGNCIAMNADEILAMEVREKAVATAIAARRALLANGNSCKTEDKTGAEVCLKITNVNFDCSKSSYGNYYNSCEASINYELETNFKGRGYLDVDVVCRVEIDYSGKGFYSTKNNYITKEESSSLYANGTDSEKLRFDFSFSNYEEVSRAKIISHKCEIDDIDLY